MQAMYIVQVVILERVKLSGLACCIATGDVFRNKLGQ